MAASEARTYLKLGLAGGPVFVGLILVQMLTRDGFDIQKHPISLLSLGTAGWIQMANFVAGGLCALLAGIGMRATLTPGLVGSTWIPRLVSLYGVGMILAGVFRADPSDGFPPGTPAGPPDHVTWHNYLHGIGAGTAFLGLVVATFILARRAIRSGRSSRAIYSAATGVTVLAVLAWPTSPFSLRLLIGVVITWAWIGSVSAALSKRILLSGGRAQRPSLDGPVKNNAGGSGTDSSPKLRSSGREQSQVTLWIF